MNRIVVVWGNCQAEPLAALLTEPLARAGFTVIPVPPVFLVDEQTLTGVQELVSDAALLLSQPIRDEYRVPGCGTDQMAALLPDTGRLLRLPSVFDSAAFPFQALAHDGSGERVAAPITNYHDLRIIAAAARGVPADELLEGWPQQPTAAAFEAHAQLSWETLTRREIGLDIRVSPVIRGDAALFTVNHPSNLTLVHLVNRVLSALNIEETVTQPAREFLGSTRTAVEAVPAGGLGWTETKWQLDGIDLEVEDVVREQLAFYRQRVDVVRDSIFRFAERLELLGLDARV